MKTSRAFMVGGAATAILTTGWALSPKATDAVEYAASSDSSLAESDSADDAGSSEGSESSDDLSEDSGDDSGLTLEDDGSDGSTDGSAPSFDQGERPEGGGHGGPPGSGEQSSGTLDDSATSAGDTGSSDGTTYTGESVQTRYGSFSVQITVVDGEVTGVEMVESGDTDHESIQINSTALPQLMEEVLETQSADVTYISGASYTSGGFAQSVADAFDQAGL
ncbi:FMN-binding protein [Demequina sp. NBRC 110054]|uniref:FMN-binding protein n=1 Tax=Demequina sp. NBRC 110054 TaxID=1570343 RepID=UPI001177EE5F|nr:FMN-binding protein [Demequina sp. NBRC 110054]